MEEEEEEEEGLFKADAGGGGRKRRRKEEEEEEGLVKADAMNEEDPERDRATPQEEEEFIRMRFGVTVSDVFTKANHP